MLAAAVVALTLFAAPVASQPIAPVSAAAISATATPAAFDPDATTRADRTTIRVTPAVAGSLGVEVITGGGIRVAELRPVAPVAAGELVEVRWDGGAVREGHYAVRVRLTDAAGALQEALVPVTVDRTGPRVAEAPPKPALVRGRRVAVSATLRDLTGIERVSLLVETQTGQPVGSVRMPAPEDGRSRLTWDLRVRGRLLLPGIYRLRVQARDAVGRTGDSAPRVLRVDRAVPSRQISRLPEAGRMVALTFDDCLDAGPWLALLRALRDAGVKGTFFCNGVNVRANPEAARATVQQGHTIGAHTWAHPMMTDRAPAEQRSQLEGDKEIWWKVARASPAPLFRPPYGDVNAQVRASAGATGFAWTVMWDVDPSDYLDPAPGVIAQRVVSASRPGSIVVMHVTANTAAAVPAMVRGLRAKGLEPAPLDEMLGAGAALSRASRG